MKQHPKYQTSTSDAHGLVRINRYLSMCGVASRRKAEQLVLEGRVRVNRSVITDLGRRVDPDHDRISVDGKPVTQVHEHVYLVLNKPKDAITTLSDERGRRTVMSLFKSRHRVYPVGRLDRNTTGVLLFTNDGEFANRLMHPRYEIPKTYRVTVTRMVAPEHLHTLRRGIALEERKTAETEVIVIPHSRGKELLITLHEGRNRQVRRMFESLGYDVAKLDRVAYGPVTCEGLDRGETRNLSRREVRKLMVLGGIEDVEDQGRGQM
jgi:23S rRNA pseudouridine2605 synthase